MAKLSKVKKRKFDWGGVVGAGSSFNTNNTSFSGITPTNTPVNPYNIQQYAIDPNQANTTLGQIGQNSSIQNTAAKGNFDLSGVAGAAGTAGQIIGLNETYNNLLDSSVSKDAYGVADNQDWNRTTSVLKGMTPVGAFKQNLSTLSDKNLSIGEKAKTFIPYYGSIKSADRQQQKALDLKKKADDQFNHGRTLSDINAQKNLQMQTANSGYSQYGNSKVFKNGGKISKGDDVNLAKKNQLEGDLISKVIMNRNRNVEFVDRAFNPSHYPQKQEFVDFNEKATHKMGYGEDDSGQSYIFPTIFNEKNEAIPVPNQYAEYISEKGYKNATGLGSKFKNGGTLSKAYTNGGTLNQLNSDTVQAEGNTHEQGGIDLSQNAEIENGETVKDNGNTMMVMSNSIKNPLSGKTFAKDDATYAKKLSKFEDKDIASNLSRNQIKLITLKREKLEQLQQLMNGNSQGQV